MNNTLLPGTLRTALFSPVLWAAFIVYLIAAGLTLLHHEMWGDELHSWNIAKGSTGYADLIHNTRYEGHPPVWYTILWIISKFTHNLIYMQAAQYMLACSFTFVVLFFSPFSLITRILIPFGYFFLFEYAVLSRNYAAGVLITFLLCMIMHKNFRGRHMLYYALLLIMSNVHLFAMVLAGSLHLYFLLLLRERQNKIQVLALHVAFGVIIFLPSLYFIFPPPDSALNAGYWLDKWNRDNVSALSQGPLRSMLPLPAWWNFQFWNTQFLLQLKSLWKPFKYICPLISLLLVIYSFVVLKKSRKSTVMFGANMVLTFIIAFFVFPLTSARYAGFIYIGFLAAYWLYCIEKPGAKTHQRLINGMLIIHLIAGFFAAYKDIKYPFSNLYQVNALLQKVPARDKTVTDYWALNAVAAYSDKPWYCIDMQREGSFVIWNQELARIQSNPQRYYDGIQEFFQKSGVNKVYLISMSSPELINQLDNKLFTALSVTLVYKTQEVPIEKGSSLYLYEIQSR